MISSRATGILLILVLSILASVAAAQEVPDHIVISEIQADSIDGTGGTDDDWIELYNPTNGNINLAAGNYRIEKTKTAADPSIVMRISDTTDGTYPGGTTIPAHGFYLIVHDDASETLKSKADAIGTRSEFTWTDTGYTFYLGTGAISSDTDPDIVDKVGFGIATYYEGTGPAPAIPDGKSIERKSLEEEDFAPCQDTDDNSADFEVRDTPTPMNSNQSPVANAGPDQTVQVGDTVHLDGSGSSDPDSDPLIYSWSFTSKPAGSAAVLSGPTIANPTFVADVAGDYTSELVVKDNYGGSDSDLVTITAHAPPTANFAYSPEQPTAWDTVQFTDQSSDSDGTVVAWSWNFGDGGSSNEQNPTHRYRLPGTYPVTLEVTDNDGLNGTTVREVEVALGLGDVDGSGTVDVLDVRIVMQAALGIVALTPEQARAADVDEDGDVDRTDAEILAEYVIGL